MHNVSDRWALGGVARLGAGSSSILTGVGGRARRWLGDGVGLDLSAGATFVSTNSPGQRPEAVGFSTDIRINLEDHGYAGVRLEGVSLDEVRGPEDSFDPGGNLGAVSLLLGLGSDWTLMGTGALAAWLAFLLATVDWS